VALRREPTPGGSDLRARLAERDRRWAAEWAGFLGVGRPDPLPDVGGWAARADAIDRGEPVVVACWEFDREDRPGLPVDGWVVVHRSGRLEWSATYPKLKQQGGTE